MDTFRFHYFLSFIIKSRTPDFNKGPPILMGWTKHYHLFYSIESFFDNNWLKEIFFDSTDLPKKLQTTSFWAILGPTEQIHTAKKFLLFNYETLFDQELSFRDRIQGPTLWLLKIYLPCTMGLGVGIGAVQMLCQHKSWVNFLQMSQKLYSSQQHLNGGFSS